MNNFDRAEAAWEARQDAAMEARHAEEEARQDVIENMTAAELLEQLEVRLDMPSALVCKLKHLLLRNAR